MTVVLTEIEKQPLAAQASATEWRLACGLTASSTYKTGGDESFKTAVEAVLKQQGIGVIDFVVVNGVPGYFIQYNYKTGKLQVFEGAAGLLKELAEAEYPAAIREAGILRAMILGR